MPEESEIKVYYNSACPVCKAGIEWQQGKESPCSIQWNDVHSNNQLVTEIGSDLEFVRERLHVVNKNGQLATGFDAFLVIWQEYPKERWKTRLLGLPVIKHICRAIYNVFAARLYQWNRSKKRW